MKDVSGDVFDSASAYDAFMGRWSRLVAKPVVDWLAIRSGQVWLDVGAGTGVLTQVILDEAAPKKIVAIDLSEHYLEHARRTIRDERVEFKQGNASSISFEAVEFDVVVAGLVLNFVPSPELAMQGMKEVVRENGTIAAYVWDYGDRMEMMRHFWDAAKAVDASAAKFYSETQYSICDPRNLRALFESARLTNIDVVPIDVQTRFANLDDFWLPFLGAQGSASKYLRTLDGEKRNAIRGQLLRQLPIESDDQIHLTARAWAIKGTA